MTTRAATKGLALTASVVALSANFLTAPTTAHANDATSNGRIAFYRHSRTTEVDHVYSVNPDGTRVQRLTAATSAHPHWSPDGTEIAVDAQIDTPTQPSAVIYKADTGTVRELTGTLGRVCFVWSPDGSRLACSGDGLNGDNSIDPGIATIRSADGGDLQRVTDFVGMPGSYSPDGKRLSLVGDDGDGLRMFVVRLNGTGLRPLTPIGMPGLLEEDGGSWSPDGTQIIFQARTDPDHRVSIWSVHPDGTGLQMLPVPGCGGLVSDPYSIACREPAWSPDGRQLAFSRYDSHTGERNIYTVYTDGSGLTQVTNSGNADQFPDWGTHPTLK